jgi:hypothetical protein
MVVAKGGLCNITHNVPLIYSILWCVIISTLYSLLMSRHYMALALDQGVQWEYIPPICTKIRLSGDVEVLICAEELMLS